jgi:hypothetical protein
MVAVVGQVHRVVGPIWTPWARGYMPLAPRAQEIAVAVEHHHRVLAAIEDVDVVVLVDARPRRLP